VYPVTVTGGGKVAEGRERARVEGRERVRKQGGCQAARGSENREEMEEVAI